MEGFAGLEIEVVWTRPIPTTSHLGRLKVSVSGRADILGLTRIRTAHYSQGEVSHPHTL